MEQLQFTLPALGRTSEEVMRSQCAVNTIVKQLQELQADEHVAYMLFMKQVGYEVIMLQLLSCTCISGGV